MLYALRRAWKQALAAGRQLLTSHALPSQMALGTMVGAALGLLPLGLLAVPVMLLCWHGLKASLSAGLVGWFGGLLLASCIEPFLHRLGFLVLTWTPVVPLWTWLFNLPLVPWTGFHNTLVMGGLLTALYVCFPVYVLSKLLANRYQAKLLEQLRQYPLWIKLCAAELATGKGGSNAQ